MIKMARLYILIRRKGVKKWLGAIPTKKGATVKKLRLLISRQVKKGFVSRIVTASQLKKVISRQAPRTRLRKLKRRSRKRPRKLRRGKSKKRRKVKR